MAHPSFKLIETLREAADRLRNGAAYAWGHHGTCNCGHILQVATDFDAKKIIQYAHTGIGEWSELSSGECAITDAPVNFLLATLENLGLTGTDIHHLEYLTDREVLNQVEGGFRWLKKNQKQDVIAYFEAFAVLMEQKMLTQIRLPKELLDGQIVEESELVLA